jgi:hypothetical protein
MPVRFDCKMMLCIIICTLPSLCFAQLNNGFHGGAGMGYDSETGTSCMQFSVGFNYQRLYASVNKTFPLDRHAPTLWQGRIGIIAGSRAKAILYAGFVNRSLVFHEKFSQEAELHPETHRAYSITAPMYGIELSKPVRNSSCRLFTDLNFSGAPFYSGKNDVLNYRVQFVPVFGVKCFLGHADDCYPRRVSAY